MPLHAQGQRFQPAQGEKAVERTADAADRILQKTQPLGQVGALADDGHPADHVRVPIEVLGHRMHDNVETQFQRALHVGRGKRVVGYRNQPVLARERGQRFQIGQLEQRVGRRLDPHHPRVGANGG